MHESRSADLEKRGLIDADGDGWTYTGEWQYPDATTYVEALLDCSDDWAEQLGDEWELESTDCLADIGASTMAGYFVAETLTLSEGQEEADEGRADAVSALDECYVADPPEPSAKARSAYRAVVFKFDDLGPEAGTATLQVRDDGAWKPLDGRTHAVDTDAGGRKGCVDAQVEATFPWGTDERHRQALLRPVEAGPDLVGAGQEVHLHRGMHHLGPALRGRSRPSTPRACGCSRTAATATPRADECEHTFVTSATGTGCRRELVGLPGIHRAIRGAYPQDDRPTRRAVSAPRPRSFALRAPCTHLRVGVARRAPSMPALRRLPCTRPEHADPYGLARISVTALA